MRQSWIGRTVAICVAVLVLSGPRAAAAQSLQLAFDAGRVTLDARDVTVRQVLDEWATRGQVVVVHADLVGERRVTLQLDNVPERQAIDALLRSVAGFVVVERGPDTTGPSIFGRILVVAEGELRAATGASASDVDSSAALPAVSPTSPSTEPPLPRDSIDRDAVQNTHSDTASGQAPGSPFAAPDVLSFLSLSPFVKEPPNGRPDGPRPASARAAAARAAPAGAKTPVASIAAGPANGRPDEARPILATAIGKAPSPTPPAAPAKATDDEPPKSPNDVNGRDTTK